MSSPVSAPSRNAPCHCGSGKRYKDCHGALRSTAAGWVERGLAQIKARDFDAAEASLREAQHLAPNDARVHANFGTLHVHWQRYADAEESLATALSLAPDEPYVLALLAHTRQCQCAWHGLSSLHGRIADTLDRGDAGSACDPFALLSMPLTAPQQLVAAQRYARSLGPLKPTGPSAFAVASGGRMRIGFVSADFRRHATAALMTEFWERIDRSRLEVFAYGIFARDKGRAGQRIERAFEHFDDLSNESVDGIARRIRNDRIDVLFDLNGYTRSAQPQIFALRPAPVQVNAIGFQGTLGAKWYDYILTDDFSMPERLAPFFTEAPLFMPHALYPSDTTRLAPGPPPSRAACGLPEHAFVFCCFNNAYKILPEVFAIWMRLLAAVPGSVLWLLETHQAAKENLRHEATLAGIDPSRLVFARLLGLEEHVSRNAAADLFIDTYPYGAHTTANDALLAGLPLLTRAGETLASRVAGSQLHAVGLPELVTESFADYEALALRLATQAGPLNSYRERLTVQRHSSPLFDMDRYARDFTDVVLRIEARHRTR